jgi:hypothetical protein
MKTQKGAGRGGGWNAGLQSTFRHSTQQEQKSCQLYASAAIYLKEIPWYSFLLHVEWTSGLLNADSKIKPFQNFQGPHQEWNPRLPARPMRHGTVSTMT